MDYMKRLRTEPQCHEEPRLEGMGRRLLHDPNDRGMGMGMDPRGVPQGAFGGRGGGGGGRGGGPMPGGGDERWMKRQQAMGPGQLASVILQLEQMPDPPQVAWPVCTQC